MPLLNQPIMITQFTKFEDLIDGASDYLKNWSFGSKSLRNYQTIWRDLGRYMKANDIEHYNGSIGLEYLNQVLPTLDYKLLSRWSRSRIRAITALSDFSETGSIRLRKKKRPPIVLEGPIGGIMADHVAHSKNLHNLATETVCSYQLYLSVFLRYLNENKISSLGEFNAALLIAF